MKGVIDIRGEIGLQTTLASVESQIEQYPQATEWAVMINSPGGNVYEGIDIYHAIKKLSNVTVYIETMAASIATLIMQAGDTVVALRPCSIMIHNPSGMTEGDAADFRAAAEQLDHIKSLITGVYAKRAKVKTTVLNEMMDKETWMTADQAADLGFVDLVQDKIKAVAKYNNLQMDATKKIQETLDALMAKFSTVTIKTIKNIAATLSDGTAIIIESEDPNAIQGAKITKEDGTPVEDGPHTLADGRQIVVQGGVIQQVTDPAMEDKQLEALKQENAQLKEQLATATQAAAKAAGEAAATNKAFAEFKNSMTEEIKNLKATIIGTTTPPIAPTHTPDPSEGTVLHPMFMKFHNHVNDIWKDRQLVKA